MEQLQETNKPSLIASDKVIWILVMFFAMTSVLAVFSTSTFLANSSGVSKTMFFFRQMKDVALGFGALILCYKIPLHLYRKCSLVIYAASILLLAMALVMGENINGASRGIKVFGKTFQVLEFAKIGLVFYLAKALETWGDSISTFKEFALKLMLPIALTCLLVVPNSASTAVLLGALSMLIMFFMGVRFRYLAAMASLALAALAVMVGIYLVAFDGKPVKPGHEQSSVEKLFNRVGTSKNRIINFKSEFAGTSAQETENLTKDEIERIRDKNRQSENAKIAISEGGILGKGPGKSTQRYSLSEAFSDFIYASIVEEYGLLGGIFVLLLYSTFLFRCIRLTISCQKPFSQTLVTGLSWLIAIQAMLHILVNVRLAPITGHTLPLISHGGTAMLVLSGAFGIILSVSRQVNRQAEEKIEEAPCDE